MLFRPGSTLVVIAAVSTVVVSACGDLANSPTSSSSTSSPAITTTVGAPPDDAPHSTPTTGSTATGGSPDPDAVRAEQDQLRQDCADGHVAHQVCAEWGYPADDVVTSRPQSEVQLQHLCELGEADPELCRESGF